MFVICTLRSGSTLLRVLLDSHSQIRSPHELHLRYVSVNFDQKWSERSMKELGLDTRAAEYLLWDRSCTASSPPAARRSSPTRRPTTSSSSTACARLARRALHLPAPPPGRDRALAAGIRGEGTADDDDKNAELIRRYVEAVEAARQTYDGHTVRYEDLTADPERELRGHLLVPRHPVRGRDARVRPVRPRALQVRPRRLEREDQVRPIQQPEPPPPLEEIPPALREMCVKWGYLEAEVPLDRGA